MSILSRTQYGSEMRFYSIHFYDVTRIKVLRTTGSRVNVRHASHSCKFGMISDNFVILTILSELLFFFRRGDNNLYISSPRKNKNELVEFADCTKAKTCRKLLRNNTCEVWWVGKYTGILVTWC